MNEGEINESDLKLDGKSKDVWSDYLEDRGHFDLMFAFMRGV